MYLGLSRNFWVTLVAIGVVTAAAIIGPRLYRIALLGSGFMAQTLCAGVFVSKRDPADIRAEELSGPRYELLRFFQPRIDRTQETVSASLHGFAERTSIHREGLGCTLVVGKTADQLRAEAANLFPRPPPLDRDALWPEGKRVDLFLPEGVDRQALDAAIANIFAEPDPARPRRTRALVVVYRGRIVVERYAEGFNAEMPLVGWSLSKTATEALVGLRVKDGKLDVSQDQLMPEWRGEDDPRGRITLDELMRMTSGLAFDEDYNDDLSDVTQMLFVQSDVAAFAADKPLAHKPGSYWYYSSGSTNIISAVLKQTFSDLRDYLRFPHDRLFMPLGMRTAVLQPDASGTFIAASSLYASARDWARLGLLFLQDGIWEGKRLLPAGWLAYTLRPTPQAPDERFGAQIWLKLTESENFGEPPMPEDAYYMLGHDQQTVAIVPSRDLVVVRLGLTREVGDWDDARELGPLVNAFPRALNKEKATAPKRCGPSSSSQSATQRASPAWTRRTWSRLTSSRQAWRAFLRPAWPAPPCPHRLPRTGWPKGRQVQSRPLRQSSQICACNRSPRCTRRIVQWLKSSVARLLRKIADRRSKDHRRPGLSPAV